MEYISWTGLELIRGRSEVYLKNVWGVWPFKVYVRGASVARLILIDLKDTYMYIHPSCHSYIYI